MLDQWARGVSLDGAPSQPVQVSVADIEADHTLLELVMGEGKNRQIRRTAELLGHRVVDLQRIGIGPIHLGALPEGRWRRINDKEWN